MNLRTFLTKSHNLSDVGCVEGFVAHWKPLHLSKEEQVCRQGHPEADEYIVLEGRLASCICGKDGKEICVGFYVGPCVITPNIARTRDGESLVSIVATTDASLVRMDSDLLSELMISSEPVRNWANGILREALSRKVDREWCLAALSGAERLAWFRREFPGYEDTFPHSLIASFLGVTPVTMSRLRAKDKNQ